MSSLLRVLGSFIPLVASDVVFGVVFGVFVAALAVLAFVSIRWGVRRDRLGRKEWERRRSNPVAEGDGPSQGGGAPIAGPEMDGEPSPGD